MRWRRWNRHSEACRQAAIMLEDENLDKSNVHHQSRNGAAPWAAAIVSKLGDNSAWLSQVAPAMIECARWSESVRKQSAGERTALTQGLLPAHIYGGDVRDHATSLYATAMCWKGMLETADALHRLGDEHQRKVAVELRHEADDLRRKVLEVTQASITGRRRFEVPAIRIGAAFTQWR